MFFLVVVVVGGGLDLRHTLIYKSHLNFGLQMIESLLITVLICSMDF